MKSTILLHEKRPGRRAFASRRHRWSAQSLVLLTVGLLLSVIVIRNVSVANPARKGSSVNRNGLLRSGPITKALPANAENQTVSFVESDEVFPNPERGFAFENDVKWADEVTWDYCGQGNNFTAYDYTSWNTPLDPVFLASERAAGRSVIMSRYHIADFRNRDITAEYLAFLDRDFAAVRQAGMKQIIRFAYNYPLGGPDTSLEQVLAHLDQLKPVLQRNKDVIATMEAGLIGCWGEWHSSSNNLVPTNDGLGSATDGHINAASRAIIDKLLEVLPADRMVQLRYPRNKFEYLGSNDLSPVAALTEENAFKGSAQSRLGHHDDCFVCNPLHGGSWWNPRGAFEETPNFLKQENLYVAQGGEPGDPESTDPLQPPNPNSPLSACDKNRSEFREMHWSTVGLFNVNIPASATKRWQRDGCWDEFNRNLGYRFRLTQATIPKQGQAGNTAPVEITMVNDGYARPYNPRHVELVLRNTATGVVSRIQPTTPQDERLWLPGPGETKTLTFDAAIPAGLASGSYDVLLNLPDPESTLNLRSEYSIRLANADIWEPTTGYNSLNSTILIR